MVGLSGSVDDEAGRELLALVARHLDLAFGDDRRGDVEDDRRAARDRRAGRDRIGGEPAVAPAMGRDEDAETRRVDEVERDEPGLGELLGPGADAAEMAGIPQSENDEALIGGPLGGERHGLLADHLAVAEAAVDEERAPCGRRRSRACRLGTTMPVAGPVDIFADAHDAMGIVTDEVGLDQMVGDGPGLRLVRSGAAEDRRRRSRPGRRVHSASSIFPLPEP